jgi:hypothetical protein
MKQPNKKNFNPLDSFFSLLPFFILTLLSGLILIVFFRSNLTFEQLIELLRVFVWPAIVLISLLFFRKVFTYLFFSIEEFNFFGAKGKLKNVRTVVMEKAQDMYESRISLETQEEELRLNNEELENLRNRHGDVEEKNEEIFQIAKRILVEKDELLKQNNALKDKIESLVSNDGPSNQELQTMINDLMAQIASLQNQKPEQNKIPTNS